MERSFILSLLGIETEAIPSTIDCPNCKHSLLAPAKLFPSLGPDLLTADVMPTKHQGALIAIAIAEANAELTRLTSETRRAQGLVDQLAIQRNMVETYIAKNKALLAPIRRVPTEILAEIFTHCLPDSSIRPLEPSIYDHVQIPLLLAQISRRWRDVALSLPQLWSSISAYPFQSLDGAVSSMETSIRRSGNHPLFITISFNEDCTPLLETIIPHSERWRSVSFNLTPWMHEALAPVKGRLPSLISLELDSNEGHYSFVEIYGLAPRLSMVKLADDFMAALTSECLPWAQITTWSGSGTAENCFEVLRLAPNLVSCTFNISSSMGLTIPIFHLSVSTLCVAFHDEETMIEFLSYLNFPALRSLSIRSAIHEAPSWPVETLRTFLKKLPLLEALVLEIEDVEIGLVQSLLQIPPPATLTVMCSIHLPLGGETLLERLVYDEPSNDITRDNSQLLVSNLRIFRLHGHLSLSSSPSSLELVVLLGLVESALLQEASRSSRDPRSLRLIYIEYGGDMFSGLPQDLARRLKELEELGLGVSLQQRWPVKYTTVELLDLPTIAAQE